MNIAKLEKIVKSDTRYYKTDNEENQYTIAKTKIMQRLKDKFNRIYALKREAVLAERFNSLPMLNATRFAKQGDEFRLRQEMLFGHPVDYLDPKTGRSVLLEACAGGHFHIVRMLVNEFNAEVNISTSMGKSSTLHLAVEGGYRQIASFLITNGADINGRDKFQRTPLHLINKVTLMKLLLKYKVDVVAKSNEGLTPLRHYMKYTPVEEHLFDIVITLGELEDKRNIEITRAEIESLRLTRTTALNKWLLVNNDDSTINSYVNTQNIRNSRQDIGLW